MSGETKEVFGSNYGQNDVIINGLIDKMTLFDDNLMSLVFGQNIETTELLFRVMLELSQDVGHRLRVHELMACGVQVSIRTNDLYGSQYQCKLPFRTQLPNEIAGVGFHLLMERYRWDKPIRAVTIRGIDLVSQKDAEQLSMFVDHQKRDRRILLEDAVEDIRRRFGKRAISYAILMGDLKIPDDGRQLVTMPGLMYQ